MSGVLVLVITGVVLGMVIFTMVLFLNTYQQSLVRSAQTSSRQAVEQVSNTVAGYVSDMDGLLTLVKDTLEETGRDDQLRREFFEDLLLIRTDVAAVTTYDSAGNLLDCRTLEHEPRENIYQNLSFQGQWLSKYGEGYISQPHVESIFPGWYPWVVTMIEPLESDGEEAWVALDLRFASISSYINNVGIGQHGYCFLMDESGILYHPQQQLIYSQLKSEDTAALAALPDGTYSENNVIYVLKTVEGSPWRVVGVSYVDELVTSNVWENFRLLALAAAAILLAAFLSSVFISRALSRPLKGLSSAMRLFEKNAGTFTYAPVGGAREVQELSESFGHMVVKIQHLMETVRREEINLRKTELKALQAQINPHFLYNTLDSIAWMCEQGRNDEAVQMVNALAQLFRISISRGHELIPIRSELRHAESYLKIQKHRYKNQFSYRFDVDESCLDFLCNKITLQPIIENAIYHGINGLVDEGEIVITLRAEGQDVVFTVADNGVGMEEEQIQAILRKERSDHTGIGIKNVNDRLKIYFGEGYGITIDSEPDVGTTVTIRMPQVREEGEYENR
ncbi:MAG TPA: sensor histidine kinase [Candidatus Avoscillospira stercoripullorum]|uniref:histidine kinase n=1 Tax=Candidatus Avoscillospira stercoripullorum TaxID=2840709 RepID=A0A9D1D7D7_9FIRM|nr:sensor histidine kinase [Candidatus Avoscillospira stercoripullorum]